MGKTSSAVKRKYNEKVYKQVKVELKKELVNAWELQLDKDGLTKAAFIRKAIQDYLSLSHDEHSAEEIKEVYPVILTPDSPGYLVAVPDFNINTQGCNLAEAIEMARDAISIIGVDMEDDGEKLPDPSPLKKVQADFPDNIVTLVDINFTNYRKKLKSESIQSQNGM